MDGGSANTSPNCVTGLFATMHQSGAGHVQLEFSACSKGLRCAPRSRLVSKLQIDVGRADSQVLEVTNATDAGVPNLHFVSDLVCTYSGFDVVSDSAVAGTDGVPTKRSDFFEARAVLAQYYHRPRRYRDNYVSLLRRKLSASNVSEPKDVSSELMKEIERHQQQATVIGKQICETLARRLSHQSCWLPAWSCGRLTVGITRIAIAHLIPKLLLAQQGVRPIEQQVHDTVASTWQLLQAAWSVGAAVGRQGKSEQAASK